MFMTSTFLILALVLIMIVANCSVLTTVGGVPFSLMASSETMSLSVVLIVVSLSITAFSGSYMSSEAGPFLKLLTTFIVSMMVLIHSGSFPVLMLGWDGLGLTSFFLILYYQPSLYSESCGFITLLTNRIGDCLLFLCLPIFLASGFSLYNLPSVSILLILAAMTKSAQWPFSSWLPAAMAAPTPVSALVHSSTLVVAGAYLLSVVGVGGSSLIAFVGALTYCMGAALSAMENDLKKLIAFSTLSHMGLLFIAIGLGQVELGMLHLVMHALFKSSLFIVAGYRMMASEGAQDTRAHGFSVGSVLTAYLTIISANLLVIPFVGASLSKHPLVIDSVQGHSMIVGLIVFGTLMGGVYTARVLKTFGMPSSPVILSVQNLWAPLVTILFLIGIGLVPFSLEIHPAVPFTFDIGLSCLSLMGFLWCMKSKKTLKKEKRDLTMGVFSLSWIAPLQLGRKSLVSFKTAELLLFDPSWWTSPKSKQDVWGLSLIY